MSNTIEIPVIDYKMDKGKAIILAIVIVIVILIATGGLKNLISSITSGILNVTKGAIGGAATGLQQGIGQATGQISQSSSDQISAAETYLGAYEQAHGDSNHKGVSGPFATSSFTNSAASNLDLQTLQSIVNSIWNNLGSVFLGMNISYADGKAVFNDFSLCQSQMDVSNVAVQYANQQGRDLFYDLTYSNIGLSGEQAASDGQANVIWLQKLLQWADNLPTV